MLRILLLVVLGVAGWLAYSVVMHPHVPGSPAEAAFDAANQQIGHHENDLGFGDDAGAKAIATEFSRLMKVEQAHRFTGGAQGRTLSLTDENFLTYCRVTPDGVCLLSHVPQLKNYRDDVRVGLGEMAWDIAQLVTADRLAAGHGRIAIGLRGAALYGVLVTGRHGDRVPQIETATSIKRDRLFPWFEPVATQPAATPAHAR